MLEQWSEKPEIDVSTGRQIEIEIRRGERKSFARLSTGGDAAHQFVLPIPAVRGETAGGFCH